MQISTIKLTKLVITDAAPNLDPIHVYAEDLGPSSGTLLVRCWDAAWHCYWGNMGHNKDGSTTTVLQFLAKAPTGYVANCLTRANRGVITSQKAQVNEERYLERIVAAIQRAAIKQQPRMTKDRLARLERLQHANDLIKAISEHGRRFFWNERDKRLARLEMDDRGKLWWIDDYRGSRVCVERFGGREHAWRGFSHGGTLKSLVQMMRDYVKNDTPISAWYIAQDCWGYNPEEAAACRAQVANNPALIPF